MEKKSVLFESNNNINNSELLLWEQIERSERYLVWSMYEEAVSLASSIITNITNNNNNNNNNHIKINCDNDDANDDDDDGIITTTTTTRGRRSQKEEEEMVEAAAMVLVQSLNSLSRTGEILNELKKLTCNSLATIPVPVILTAVCFQISEGCLSGTRQFLEDYLSSWTFVNDHGSYYTHVIALHTGTPATHVSQSPLSPTPPLVLPIDKYLQVVELYAVNLLATVLHHTDLAISWVQNAALPEPNRQAILRRLNSLHSPEATNTSHSSSSPPSADNTKEQQRSQGSPDFFKAKFPHLVENGDKSHLKLYRQADSCFWLFRTINLEFGKTRLVVSNGKILLGCLILLAIYGFRKKRATLTRIAARQASNIKKALVDLWQLAFSYQVNPLAAVQPLSAAGNVARG